MSHIRPEGRMLLSLPVLALLTPFRYWPYAQLLGARVVFWVWTGAWV